MKCVEFLLTKMWTHEESNIEGFQSFSCLYYHTIWYIADIQSDISLAFFERLLHAENKHFFLRPSGIFICKQ